MRTYLTIFTLALAAAVAIYAADAKAGKAVYDTSCKSCHGPDGTPNPAVAKMMKVEMKDLKTSDADIPAVIANGKGKMQPVKPVNAKSAEDVAAYVHSFKK